MGTNITMVIMAEPGDGYIGVHYTIILLYLVVLY